MDKISILRHFAKIAADPLMDGAYVCSETYNVLSDSKRSSAIHYGGELNLKKIMAILPIDAHKASWDVKYTGC